jgi:hypothetical protein
MNCEVRSEFHMNCEVRSELNMRAFSSPQKQGIMIYTAISII